MWLWRATGEATTDLSDRLSHFQPPPHAVDPAYPQCRQLTPSEPAIRRRHDDQPMWAGGIG